MTDVLKASHRFNKDVLDRRLDSFDQWIGDKNSNYTEPETEATADSSNGTSLDSDRDEVSCRSVYFDGDANCPSGDRSPSSPNDGSGMYKTPRHSGILESLLSTPTPNRAVVDSADAESSESEGIPLSEQEELAILRCTNLMKVACGGGGGGGVAPQDVFADSDSQFPSFGPMMGDDSGDIPPFADFPEEQRPSSFSKIEDVILQSRNPAENISKPPRKEYRRRKGEGQRTPRDRRNLLSTSSSKLLGDGAGVGERDVPAWKDLLETSQRQLELSFSDLQKGNPKSSNNLFSSDATAVVDRRGRPPTRRRRSPRRTSDAIGCESTIVSSNLAKSPSTHKVQPPRATQRLRRSSYSGPINASNAAAAYGGTSSPDRVQPGENGRPGVPSRSSLGQDDDGGFEVIAYQPRRRASFSGPPSDLFQAFVNSADTGGGWPSRSEHGRRTEMAARVSKQRRSSFSGPPSDPVGNHLGLSKGSDHVQTKLPFGEKRRERVGGSEHGSGQRLVRRSSFTGPLAVSVLSKSDHSRGKSPSADKKRDGISCSDHFGRTGSLERVRTPRRIASLSGLSAMSGSTSKLTQIQGKSPSSNKGREDQKQRSVHGKKGGELDILPRSPHSNYKLSPSTGNDLIAKAFSGTSEHRPKRSQSKERSRALSDHSRRRDGENRQRSTRRRSSYSAPEKKDTEPRSFALMNRRSRSYTPASTRESRDFSKSPSQRSLSAGSQRGGPSQPPKRRVRVSLSQRDLRLLSPDGKSAKDQVLRQVKQRRKPKREGDGTERRVKRISSISGQELVATTTPMRKSKSSIFSPKSWLGSGTSKTTKLRRLKSTGTMESQKSSSSSLTGEKSKSPFGKRFARNVFREKDADKGRENYQNEKWDATSTTTDGKTARRPGKSTKPSKSESAAPNRSRAMARASQNKSDGDLSRKGSSTSRSRSHSTKSGEKKLKRRPSSMRHLLGSMETSPKGSSRKRKEENQNSPKSGRSTVLSKAALDKAPNVSTSSRRGLKQRSSSASSVLESSKRVKKVRGVDAANTSPRHTRRKGRSGTDDKKSDTSSSGSSRRRQLKRGSSSGDVHKKRSTSSNSEKKTKKNGGVISSSSTSSSTPDGKPKSLRRKCRTSRDLNFDLKKKSVQSDEQ